VVNLHDREHGDQDTANDRTIKRDLDKLHTENINNTLSTYQEIVAFDWEEQDGN
jgi:hypothetical protein